MNIITKAFILFSLFISVIQVQAYFKDNAEVIEIDIEDTGRVFEGIGALSAGASSRLLIDYPQESRDKILDLLFKPKYGASFHHLKVEIGGEVNSTDGTEPSHARTREEFVNSNPEYFNRGYEWFLMKEAKKRNPNILLDALQWGATEWIGDKEFPRNSQGQIAEQKNIIESEIAADGQFVRPKGEDWQQRDQLNRKKFFTRDNADYVAAFISGAKKYHNLDIDYCGIWNEMPYTVEYIKLLRKRLNENGLGKVNIVAADITHGDWKVTWEVANQMLADKELMDAVAVIGVHYTGTHPYNKNFESTEQAKQTNKPLWSSEDGHWSGQWSPGAVGLARLFNRNYVRGKMTKTIIWSLVSSYYENLPIPNSGPMKANQPWSGNFQIQPATWAIAHTTQFTQPGWQYLDRACVEIEGGSIVSLRSPDGKDVSIIIETMDADKEQQLVIDYKGTLQNVLYLWRSTKCSQFDELVPLKKQDGKFSLSLLPEAIYTITTTTGQQKANPASPEAADFPIPYSDDFESYQIGQTPKYFSDQGGAFEAAGGSDGNTVVLEQVIRNRGIEWAGHPTPEPYTVIGSTKWTNYEVACDVLIKDKGYAAIFGRIIHCPQSEDTALGYWLKLQDDGNWFIYAHKTQLAFGKIDIKKTEWHKLSLSFNDEQIKASIDGKQITMLADLTYGGGMAGIGSGFSGAQFDNFQIIPGQGASENFAVRAIAASSSNWSEEYDASKATDQDVSTRWNAAQDKVEDQWLKLDWKEPITISKIVVRQFEPRIKSYKIQYYINGQWNDVARNSSEPQVYWVDKFDPITTDNIRLLIESSYRCPSIIEIAVYGDDK